MAKKDSKVVIKLIILRLYTHAGLSRWAQCNPEFLQEKKVGAESEKMYRQTQRSKSYNHGQGVQTASRSCKRQLTDFLIMSAKDRPADI